MHTHGTGWVRLVIEYSSFHPCGLKELAPAGGGPVPDPGSGYPVPHPSASIPGIFPSFGDPLPEDGSDSSTV